MTQQADPQTEPKAAKTDPDTEDDVMFKVDLQARKAGLRAQLAAFTKVLKKACPCMQFALLVRPYFAAWIRACSSKITQHHVSPS